MKKIAIVVDANAIIKQIPLRQTINQTLTTDEEFNRMYEIYTLQEVV
jgi:cyanate lyase